MASEEGSYIDPLLKGEGGRAGDAALVIVSWLFWGALFSVLFLAAGAGPDRTDLASAPGVARAAASLREPAILEAGGLAVFVPDPRMVMIHDSGEHMIILLPGAPKGSAVAVTFDALDRPCPVPGAWTAGMRTRTIKKNYTQYLCLFRNMPPAGEVKMSRAVSAAGMPGFEVLFHGKDIVRDYVELYSGRRRFRYELVCPASPVPGDLLALFRAIVCSTDVNVVRTARDGKKNI